MICYTPDMRPKLSDPQEFAVIKSVYFKDRSFRQEDPIEQFDRMNHTHTRNEAR